MRTTRSPQDKLAEKNLPKPLYQALGHIYAQGIQDTVLVGGTALAGYYYGHRRSDDLDLFSKTPLAHQATILAVQSLETLGVQMKENMHTAQFYRAQCHWFKHWFTVDVVLDQNWFTVGSFEILPSRVWVAHLEAIFMTKIATLVSRCSEKDLYDLVWLWRDFENLSLGQILAMGQKIDGGLHLEGLLISMGGNPPREEACGFAQGQGRSANQVFLEISRFRHQLLLALNHLAKKQPLEDDPYAHSLAKIIKGLKKLQ